MKSLEFISEFIGLEYYLYSLVPAFDKQRGFIDLINTLNVKNQISSEDFEKLSQIWEARNLVVSSAQILTVDEHIVKKMQEVKDNMKI